jgi:hypothetical protein
MIKQIVSYMTMILVAVGLNGCGEDSSTDLSSSGDSANKVIFNPIDNDSFSITLECNNNDYDEIAFSLTDSDGLGLDITTISSEGTIIMTCLNSYSSIESNLYVCNKKSSLSDIEFAQRFTFYKNKSYAIDLLEYNIGEEKKITHITTLQGEY